MTPDEIMRQPEEAMILLTRGQRPTLARKTCYHSDPVFRTLFDASWSASVSAVASRRARAARIKGALARDPGQTMKNIGAFSIAATEGRERGNSRHVRVGRSEAAGA
jgi:type IV secretory pathway TraG/TraD family ATPase VirD4